MRLMNNALDNQKNCPFLKDLKKHRKNYELLQELDQKIRRLEEDPIAIGGELSGNLVGKRSTRLASKFRLIFKIDEGEQVVYLMAIDHRGKVY